MPQKTNKPKLSEFFVHETKKHTLIKFLGLVVIVVSYFIYMSVRLGTENGILVTCLTWSFFVFCTPVADAGFLLAFPVRLLAGVRMIYTQIFSFLLAFSLNLYAYFRIPAIYEKTIILKLYYQILSHPFPFWIIILISLAGTIMSIYFGDELVDVAAHHQREKYHKHVNKHQMIAFGFLIGLTVILYKSLLTRLGVDIPL